MQFRKSKNLLYLNEKREYRVKQPALLVVTPLLGAVGDRVLPDDVHDRGRHRDHLQVHREQQRERQQDGQRPDHGQRDQGRGQPRSRTIRRRIDDDFVPEKGFIFVKKILALQRLKVRWI